MKNSNLSEVSDEETARTPFACASQRAENLAILGAKNVLELCVGPSLRVLERAYEQVGIKVTGNDIDMRWRSYHPGGSWVIGDALEITAFDYMWDTMVFAPPLSHGCTGRRADSLMINEVTPKYTDFLHFSQEYKGILTLVLPARSLATRDDRSQFHSLLSNIEGSVEVVPLVDGCVKYYDVYIDRRNS